MGHKWKAIVNPLSGSGKAKSDWPIIDSLLNDANVDADVVFTEHSHHATELVRSAIADGCRNFIAVGGDGTIHEVVCGIMTQSEVPTDQITLGVIPVGSGNDWIKLYSIPMDYAENVRIIAAGRTVGQDVARVTSLKEGRIGTSYMTNIGGIAFDADVCINVDGFRRKGQRGKLLYIKGLIKALGVKTHYCFNVAEDGREYFRGDLMSIAFGIGKYSGGGMLQTPEATPDDGLIDMTIIEKMSLFKILCKAPRLFTGTLLKTGGVRHTRAARYEVQSTPAANVEIDGENAGTTPVTVECVPLAINVVVP